jgi:galactokinase
MFENAEEEWSDVKFGKLLNDHFDNLKNYKQISTVKIDKMVEICLENGAWGAKINGSGGT